MLQVIGLVGLPGDLKLWRNVVIPAIVAAIPGFFAFAKGAPWWQIALITLGVFVVLFLVSVLAERAIVRRRRVEHPPPTETGQSATPRIGWHSQGGSNRVRGMRIRNQDRGIDSKDTDWDAKDIDIE